MSKEQMNKQTIVLRSRNGSAEVMSMFFVLLFLQSPDFLLKLKFISIASDVNRIGHGNNGINHY